MAGRDMVFNQSCYGLQSRSLNAPNFVYFATVRAVEQLQSIAHGSVFSTITRKTFESLDAVDPILPVLAAFEKETGRYLERAFQLGQESRTLAALRDTLLPKLMSGGVSKSCWREGLKRAGA